MKKIILSSIACIAIGTTQLSHADAPAAQIGGDVNNDIELRGAVINFGAAAGGLEGGNVDVEVSVGTVHGNSTVGGDVNNNITVYGLLGGISIVNAVLTWQGNACGKVAIGSIGASTCTYDPDSQ